MTDDKLDQTLKQHFSKATADDAGVARVMAKLSGPLPAQKRATPWPQLLLDWQFAPAWPRVAALACCAAVGFIVGTASVDRLSSHFASNSNDLTIVAFEPEPLTGLRP
jgi:hypothetical protein